MDAHARSAGMHAGRACFNRGEFFEAHERWEAVWLGLAAPERGWVQGLIQIAAGLHKLARAEPRPGAALLRKGLAKLHGAPPRLDDVDIDAARAGAERLLEALDRGQAPGAEPFPI
jgi:predicted metal-dependent hydrolase